MLIIRIIENGGGHNMAAGFTIKKNQFKLTRWKAIFKKIFIWNNVSDLTDTS